jgi:hypothetical protein
MAASLYQLASKTPSMLKRGWLCSNSRFAVFISFSLFFSVFLFYTQDFVMVPKKKRAEPTAINSPSPVT